MKTTVHVFKPSGKWYTTYQVKLPKGIRADKDTFYNVLADALRTQNPNHLPLSPGERTLESWFAVAIVSDLPVVVWLQ